MAGQLEGEALYYTEGRLVRKVAYRAGQQNGEAVDYSREGKPVQKALYKDNLLDGTLTRYWPDGKILEIQEYRAGKPASPLRRFDQNGNEAQDSNSKPGIMQRLEQMVKG
jgi:antitoxin component YwqK of YwqJK toxin-antitoxin module